MKRLYPHLLLWFFIAAASLLVIGVFATYYLAQRQAGLGPEAVAKLKKPISPEGEKAIRLVTEDLLGPPSASPKPRVVVVGIDGLDFQYLRPLLDEGKLPNFKRLMEGGAYATLLSIVPPNSGGAWPAITTGCNPGKTSLLNFRRFDPAARKVVLVDARDLRRPALWDILGAYGKKSVVINDPMGYPPHKIKGVMISGLLAPKEEVFTYPEVLTPILNKAGYQREAIPKGEGFQAHQSIFLDDLLLTERKRLELALIFLEKSDWDLFFCVFTGNDRMMHSIGEYFTLKDFEKNLVEMDQVVGAFLDRLPSGATLFLVSDHGFNLYPKNFSAPRWLEKEHYWVFTGRKAQSSLWMQGLQVLKRWKEKTPLPNIPGVRWPDALQGNPSLGPVDWEKTRAIAVEVGGNWGSIKLLKDEVHLEKEITDKLARLADPETGEPLVEEIVKGRDIFTGPYRGLLPELIFKLKNARAVFDFPEQFLVKKPTYHHRREGVVFAFGRGIRKNVILPPAGIVDVVPTVLYLLDIPLAGDLDGKILNTFFKPSFSQQKFPKQIFKYPEMPIE
ncbi:MAG: alkaline phosphatase family protein, partial [Candidatus Omnitrophota bacterium]